MSTHCLICKENGPSNNKGIYCHSDGYISYAGFILQTFYNTPEKVDSLLNLGDLSRLGYEIGDKIDFDKNRIDMEYYTEHKKQCVSYHRDRGEDFHQYVFSSLKNLINTAGELYNYVFRNDLWMVGFKEYGKDKDDIQLRPLVDVLKEDERIGSVDFQKSVIYDESITEEERTQIVNTFTLLGVLKDEINLEEAAQEEQELE